MDLFNCGEKVLVPCSGSVEQFWSSINIWICKPHCLTKRIGGTDIFELGLLTVKGIHKCIEYFSSCLNSFELNSDIQESVKSLFDKFQKICPLSKETFNSHMVLLRFLYPKSGHYFPENVELIIKDYAKQTVTFLKPMGNGKQTLVTNLPYAVSFGNENLMLFTTSKGTVDESFLWLKKVLLIRLVRWMEDDQKSTSLCSNRLISTNKYLLTYSRLKEKYLSSVLEFWNESTNPEKFISEDIAIASYLLVLWGDRITNFVDLGCGNGLLVYILSSEGHCGMGIDVRARKIWNVYPNSVVLKVQTISPSLDCVFPEADWIIGNHSDELTPWIPIIAARSSYTTNFFLLPCCPFELNGQKYIRNNTSKSSYSDYIDYLENICSVCGIEVERDRLKIPSTKRICLVSKARLYESHCHSNQQDVVKDFVLLKIKNSGELEIKLRNPIEKVKNCTQLNKEYLEGVVLDIANFIIKSSNEITSWREGGWVHLSDLINLLSSERRKFLKAQCGGLQTLLKNHSHIFLVHNGKVKLRKPSERKQPPKTIKQKKCWFFFNHPDSCPLNEIQCTYKHLS